MDVDYLVIGQGICGTLLSRDLLKLGKTVMVIDEGTALSSSRAAGGIINPVTGKRLVRSWMANPVLPFAWDTYKALEDELGVSIVRSCDILDFHATQDMKNIFLEKLEEEKEYLSNVDEGSWSSYFRFNYGIGKIAPCLLVDIGLMLDKWREHLLTNKAIVDQKFCLDDCSIASDSVVYKNIKAQKIIFCDGAACADNPYFNKLPWSKDKGEALIVSIPGLPRINMFKQGSITIVPWRNDLYWVGATHDWRFTDMKPSEIFRKKVDEQLSYWLKMPYVIVDHLVAQRPANVDRRPFVGLHPLTPSVGILNGMGGKGCSLAPYFSLQLAQHLVYGVSILPDVEIKRFEQTLSRFG